MKKKKSILNFGRCFVLCTCVACTAGSLTVSFGTLHTKVTLIRQEEWRGEWHYPSRCCTTVARKCIHNAHTLFKYTLPIRHVSQDAGISECLYTCTHWYSVSVTYVVFCSNPLYWQRGFLNLCTCWFHFNCVMCTALDWFECYAFLFSFFFPLEPLSQKCLFCPGKLCIVLLTHVCWERLLLFFFCWLDFCTPGSLTFKEGAKRTDSTGPEGAGKIIQRSKQ